MKDREIENFIKEIRVKFPDVSINIDNWLEHQGYTEDDKMYTSMMEAFSQSTTDHIKEKNTESAQMHLNYISNKLMSASTKEYEYIDVYYVESLMWDIEDKSILKYGWNLMPNNLKKLYTDMWEKKPFEFYHE